MVLGEAAASVEPVRYLRLSMRPWTGPRRTIRRLGLRAMWQVVMTSWLNSIPSLLVIPLDSPWDEWERTEALHAVQTDHFWRFVQRHQTYSIPEEHRQDHYVQLGKSGLVRCIGEGGRWKEHWLMTAIDCIRGACEVQITIWLVVHMLRWCRQKGSWLRLYGLSKCSTCHISC